MNFYCSVSHYTRYSLIHSVSQLVTQSFRPSISLSVDLLLNSCVMSSQSVTLSFTKSIWQSGGQTISHSLSQPSVSH